MARQRIARSSGTTARIVREHLSVEDFLCSMMDAQFRIDVLLASVFRPLYSGTGTTRIQAGVMLNGQRPGERDIQSCIALAAEGVLGKQGRILYPPQGADDKVSVPQRIHDLQAELLTVLTSSLNADARVGRVHQPASLWVPTTLFWDPNALVGLPITYQDGHWQVTSEGSGQPL